MPIDCNRISDSTMPTIARMPYKSIICGVVLTLSLCVGARAQEKNHVKAELISSTSAVSAGESFEIAVRFVIDAGWHMYWTNPGDSGLPPRVEWKVPEGVKVESLRFPTPNRIPVGEDLVSYGYEKELVLLATVTTSKELKGPIEIEAQVRWLVCKGVCLTEKQPAKLSVPVGDGGKPDDRFTGWRSLMPTPGKMPVGGVAKDDKNGWLLIRLDDDMQEPEFFTGDLDAAFTQFRKDGTTLIAEYKRFDTKKTSATAVLAYKDAKTGARKAIEFTYGYPAVSAGDDPVP